MTLRQKGRQKEGDVGPAAGQWMRQEGSGTQKALGRTTIAAVRLAVQRVLQHAPSRLLLSSAVMQPCIWLDPFPAKVVQTDTL
jgi:hypothetical protein